jgi:DMSO/TMAO reductase YedYZ molybdopterin-dependent catalytic subunit
LRFVVKVLALAFASLLLASVCIAAEAAPEKEVTRYQGRRLDPFDGDNLRSIKGPQKIDIKTYRLEVSGMVKEPLSLTYEEVLSLPHVRKDLTMNCVEGWSEHLLFEGVPLKDIIAKAKPQPDAKHVFFSSVDGYSTSLPYDYIVKNDIILAFKINGRTLDAKRGFPFLVAAESKYGYKWARWVKSIRLTRESIPGFWERRGFSNDADVR